MWQSFLVTSAKPNYQAIDKSTVTARNIHEAMKKVLGRLDSDFSVLSVKPVSSGRAIDGIEFVYLKCPCCNLWIKTLSA